MNDSSFLKKCLLAATLYQNDLNSLMQRYLKNPIPVFRMLKRPRKVREGNFQAEDLLGRDCIRLCLCKKAAEMYSQMSEQTANSCIPNKTWHCTAVSCLSLFAFWRIFRECPYPPWAICLQGERPASWLTPIHSLGRAQPSNLWNWIWCSQHLGLFDFYLQLKKE